MNSRHYTYEWLISLPPGYDQWLIFGRSSHRTRRRADRAIRRLLATTDVPWVTLTLYKEKTWPDPDPECPGGSYSSSDFVKTFRCSRLKQAKKR